MRYLAAILIAGLAVVGTALVLCNARPNVSIGFRAWFCVACTLLLLLAAWIASKARHGG